MINYLIFSDLSTQDLNQVKRLLTNLFINIDSVNGKKALFLNAGIDKSFLANLDFNLNLTEFINILISKVKDYPVSRRKEFNHPLIVLLAYVLKNLDDYHLDDSDTEFCEKIVNFGKNKIQQIKRELSVQVEISESESKTIDILIITALKDELDALKNCDNQSGNTWQELKDNSNYPYYKTSLNQKNGSKLNLVAARPVEMGENYTNNLATRLISELKPRCLAMTGVCAGNKKDTFLGDVIVANRVFKFDYGKLVAYYESINNQQIRTEEIFHDIRTYNLKRQWELAIQDFPQDWLNTIQIPRPKSYYHQERWLLHQLYNYQQQPDIYPSPEKNLERQIECPDWKHIIQRLREKELLTIDGLELTQKAVKEVKNERLEYLEQQRYQDPINPKLLTGVIATTSKVQQDPQLFQKIEKLQRKILGVEMEGAAIGAVAEIHEIPIIIVKGVQDYADYDKSHQFRQYAAQASARFLLAFFTTFTDW